MAKTNSTMLPLGTPLPSFSLPDTDGKVISSNDFAKHPLLVMFICNHCPFVKHLAPALAELSQRYKPNQLPMVAISSNDVEAYPQDNMTAMQQEKRTRGYLFPYMLDESQAVAKQFQAACTPEFYLFDDHHRLVYRGRFDGSTPGNQIPVSGDDLKQAIHNYLTKEPIATEQLPSIGCNIKWRPGNEPSYFAHPAPKA